LTCRLQGYEVGQFIENTMPFIKNATKLGLLVHIGSYGPVTQQFSLTQAVTIEIFDTAFL
jgi:hypothetical protein